ncbi:MAG: hypothetical protein ABTR54_12575 [Candidatus Competibacter sp.]
MSFWQPMAPSITKVFASTKRSNSSGRDLVGLIVHVALAQYHATLLGPRADSMQQQLRQAPVEGTA